MVESSPRRVTVAAVQATPVFLDRAATTDKACALIEEAAAAGASLVVFPETFIPTYPDWVWRRPAWSDGDVRRAAATTLGRHPEPDRRAAGGGGRRGRRYVAMGINEIDGGTLYNTLALPRPRRVDRRPAPQAHADRRRADRLGHGRRLHPGRRRRPRSASSAGCCAGRTTCRWPARRCTPKGVEVYVAPTWDNSDTWVGTLQHIAKEGRCYVIGCAPLLRGSDVPGRAARRRLPR